MKVSEIINLVQNNIGTWALIFIVLSTLVEITPIKINPISAILKWVSSKMNSNVIERIDKMETKLDNHIAESDARDIRRIREKILSFGTSCINNHPHTKEEYEFIIAECDKYEQYCTNNNVPNGVAAITIAEIRRRYALCMQNNSFLK